MYKLDDYVNCCYCDSFTGDGSTGCDGKIQNGRYNCCPCFSMDRILVPHEVYQAWKEETEW